MRFSYAPAACAALSGMLLWSTPVLAATFGRVGGVVEDGRPVAFVPVILRGEGEEFQTETDRNGRFLFARIPFGEYTVIVHYAGKSAIAAAGVQSDGVVDVRAVLRLPAAEIGEVHRTVTARGVADEPVSVNALTQAAIANSPERASLDRLLEQEPGIVRFSYNEPVAHGFHGITYEIDGIPAPQASATELGELLDAEAIDSAEVITGAMPAEYGGRRQGAVVNIVTARPLPPGVTHRGSVTVSAGNTADMQTSVHDAERIGTRTQVFLDDVEGRSNRGLDSPTFIPLHDASNSADHFVHTLTNVGAHATLDISAGVDRHVFQVPIAVTGGDDNPLVSVPGTDDVEKETTQSLSAAFTLNSADGRTSTRIAPWYRDDRTQYLGDTASDLAATVNGQQFAQSAITQDRRSRFTGLRLEHEQQRGKHTFKAGIDAESENYAGVSTISYYPVQAPPNSTFTDTAAQRGTLVSEYVQDRWLPTPFVTLFGGVRSDHSTGYTSGGQLSPRIEFDGKVGTRDIVHAFYGRFYAAPFLEDTRREAVLLAGGNPAAQLPVYDLKPERDQYYEIGLAHTMSPQARYYINLWKRDARDVLDTTNLADTPLQAVFNNTVGVARGIEGKLDFAARNGDTASISATVSQALAGGVDGSTFLTCPPGTAISACGNGDITLSPEDHDQTVAVAGSFTHRYGAAKKFYVTLAPQYGTGYPVEFQNGAGRLPAHLTFDATWGKQPASQTMPGLGYGVTVRNLTNRRYLIKVDNGFNTTQWGEGIRIDAYVTKSI